MRTLTRQLMAGVSIATLLLLIACKPVTAVTDKPQPTVQQLAEIEHGIQSLIGSPIARHEASCKIATLNRGNCQQSKYLLYSVEQTNEQVLLTLVNKYNQIVAGQRDISATSCSMKINKPAVILKKEVCLPIELVTE